LEAANRLIEFVLCLQRAAQVDVKVGIAGIQLDGTSVAANRRLELALHLPNAAEIIVKRLIPRVQLDRSADKVGRRVVLSTLCCNGPQEMQRIGLLGIDLQYLSIELLGMLQLAGPVITHRSVVFLGDCRHGYRPSK
jgi:hypothetical protein